MNRSFTSVVGGIVLAGALMLPVNLVAKQDQQPAPDNTSVNKRDRNSAEPTADQAKNNLSDRDMMKHIRRDVVKDKSLSTDGHNVKIISEHGKVTLKGPVRSEDERNAIKEHARKYARDENINDEMEVKGDGK